MGRSLWFPVQWLIGDILRGGKINHHSPLYILRLVFVTANLYKIIDFHYVYNKIANTNMSFLLPERRQSKYVQVLWLSLHDKRYI